MQRHRVNLSSSKMWHSKVLSLGEKKKDLWRKYLQHLVSCFQVAVRLRSHTAAAGTASLSERMGLPGNKWTPGKSPLWTQLCQLVGWMFHVPPTFFTNKFPLWRITQWRGGPSCSDIISDENKPLPRLSPLALTLWLNYMVKICIITYISCPLKCKCHMWLCEVQTQNITWQDWLADLPKGSSRLHLSHSAASYNLLYCSVSPAGFLFTVEMTTRQRVYF